MIDTTLLGNNVLIGFMRQTPEDSWTGARTRNKRYLKAWAASVLFSADEYPHSPSRKRSVVNGACTPKREQSRLMPYVRTQVSARKIPSDVTVVAIEIDMTIKIELLQFDTCRTK